CGAKTAAGSKFCDSCGAALTSTAGPTSAHAPVPSGVVGESDRPTGSSIEAQRRQLTVMVCDLVGSTELAARLDPEVLRDVVRAYQQSCDGVISHFHGNVAQYLGDGLLVYFGYPAASEHDARRAVRAGLGIIDAIATLNARLEGERAVKLSV